MGEVFAVLIEHLHPVVLVVGNVDCAFAVHSHAGGTVELAFAIAGGAELHQKGSVGGEFLDAVVAPVGDVHVAVLVNLNAPGVVELARAGALAAPAEFVLAAPGEHLHPVVAAVHFVQVVVLVKGQPGGAVNFARGVAGSAPFCDPAFVRVVYGDAVQPFVGDVSVAVPVKGYGSGPHKGAVGGGGVGFFRGDFLAEFGDDFLFVRREHRNPFAGEECRGFGAAAQHIEQVAGVAGNCYRVKESVAAADFLPADGVAVLERYRRNFSLSNHFLTFQNPAVAAGGAGFRLSRYLFP